VKITKAAFTELFSIHPREWSPSAWVPGVRFVFGHPENEIKPDQHRAALTRVYLRMACPDVDHITRTKLADSILALIDDQDSAMPQKRIADAQVVEMVWRHSQCVLNQTGRCPLLIFGKQLAEEINEFFAEDQ
jgi:hypothetical protein